MSNTWYFAAYILPLIVFSDGILTSICSTVSWFPQDLVTSDDVPYIFWGLPLLSPSTPSGKLSKVWWSISQTSWCSYRRRCTEPFWEKYGDTPCIFLFKYHRLGKLVSGNRNDTLNCTCSSWETALSTPCTSSSILPPQIPNRLRISNPRYHSRLNFRPPYR